MTQAKSFPSRRKKIVGAILLVTGGLMVVWAVRAFVVLEDFLWRLGWGAVGVVGFVLLLIGIWFSPELR